MQTDENKVGSRSILGPSLEPPRHKTVWWKALVFLCILLCCLWVLRILPLVYPSNLSSAIFVLPRFSVLGGLEFALALATFWTLLGVGGYYEWRKHLANLESIPIRIHVNGSRGKTGTCRLIGAALRANGLKVVTKTTGKMPAVIDVWGKETCLREAESDGFPEGNVREQKDAAFLAAKQEAQALVLECMALSPEIQKVSEEKFVRATVGVITNVRHDHLDVIGPDIVSAAKNLCLMIPRGQVLVTCEESLLSIIEHEAARRDCSVVKADPGTVPDFVIDSFPYITFKENVAIALKVSQILGLDKEKSLEGMLRSTPDYGTVRIFHRRGLRGWYTVVSAFGVNDVDSLNNVLDELRRRRKISVAPMVGLFNSRNDRAQRSAEFGRLMGGEIPFEKIIVTGEYVGAFTRGATKMQFPSDGLIEMEGAEPTDVLNTLDRVTPEKGVVIAAGNMVNEFGYGFIGILEEGEPAWSSQLSMIQP